jgi:serine/threonine protein kinase
VIDAEAQLIRRTLGGFTIESLIGRRTTTTVCLATHPRLNRKVALKVLSAEAADDPELRARFVQESQLAASLDHPNVIPIDDAGEDGGTFYIAMHYAEDGDLRRLLDRKGRLAPVRTFAIVEQIAGALDAMHAASFVHWDVKASNVLLGKAGHVYLSDFGLAHPVKHVDARRDVSALARMAYRCLAGQPQPEIEAITVNNVRSPLSNARAGLSLALDGVLAAAMAEDRRAHHQTAGSMARALRVAGLGTQSSGITLWAHLSET